MSNQAPENNIDPNVTVPPAVRAAAARSEELLRKSLGQDLPTEGSEGVEETPKEMTFEAPEAKEPPKETQKEPPKETPKGNDADWEHKYNSMKGRYDREAQARQTMQSQLADMQRQLIELQASRPAARDTQFERLITPDEEKDYGSEFLNVVGKKAKEEITPEIATLKEELAQIKGKLSGVDSVIQMTAREKMEQHLDGAVPNWRELNTDPEFNAWLDLPDVFSGGIRKQMLHAAYYRNDANRVAAFFKGFISDEAAVNPAKAGAGQSAQSTKVPLETFAAPGRAKTAAAPAPAEKPFFTRAQITAFYAAVNRGDFAGKDAEKQKIEQSIFEAQAAGRIAR